MTLHNAIVEVLKTANRTMSTSEIALVLNRTKAYEKKDRSEITAFQIHGRTRNYSHLFDRNKSMVSLKGKMNIPQAELVNKVVGEIKSALTTNNNFDIEDIVKRLMEVSKFKSAKNIDENVPFCPGIYCIRIKNIDALPKPFDVELKKRKHNIVYIGIATQSLNKRMLNQELRANGHGTFFRSLGAVLGYRPPLNSLVNKNNKRNYKFSALDSALIIKWINESLTINWVEQSSDLEEIETILIRKNKPLLNLAKNPEALLELSLLRKECVDIANGK
ncbi:MAG: hypothetical protein PF484_02670 [Bacteroidales bacterium]|nr:hypothetical protein [Bacteroidales bacterium]